MRIYLFMCGEGKNRSRMAAEIAGEILQSRNVTDVETRYAAFADLATIERMFQEASRVYVMEEVMEETARDIHEFGENEIHCLGIPSGLSKHPDILEQMLRRILPPLL